MKRRFSGRQHVCIVLAAAILASCNKKSNNGPEPQPAATAPAPGEGVRVTVDEHGFVPSLLTLTKADGKATVPVTFVRITDETCGKEVVFPDLNIKRDLPLNVPVTVDVPAEPSRTLTFQCGMAMYKGKVVVR